MRQLVLIALTVLAITPWSVAQQAKTVPQDVLDRIVDNDPNPLPKYLTPAERLIPRKTRTALEVLQTTAPPTGTVHTPAEYELNEGLLISWGSYNDVLTAMTVGVTTGDPDGIMYILVSGASEQSSATSTLTSAGADMSQVSFITYSTNTVWIRDYGPRFIFEDGVRAIVDHDYNRPRPSDDAFPAFLSSQWGEPLYDIGLTHGGGNFHLFATGDAFMTDLILDENSGWTESQVQDRYADYQNLDLTIYPGFPTSFDSTQHIDMWMLPVGDDEVIIGQYSSSAGQPYTITENAVTDLTSRGYTVHRTPGWNSGGTHYTYTNAVIFNDIVFVPRFGGSYTTPDAQALTVFETAFPAPQYQVIQVDCSSIIHAAGAMHCIVMHVPAYADPIPVVKVVSPNGGEYRTVGQEYDITWTAHDDVGITGVDLYYSTDGGATYPHVIALGEPDDGSFTWLVPNTPSTECRVRIVAHDADTNSGEDVSDADFEITLYGPQLFYDFPMDTNPGWTTQGQWAFGKATGGGGANGGPDPTMGSTGNNVYGYNLTGDYANGMPEYHLTSTALDCTGLEDVHLVFQRWLGVETSTYDHAYVRVSNNGTAWTTVWENTGEVADTAWIEMDLDISAVADDQSTVYLRWTMGISDSWEVYCGWNIDDVEIWAIGDPVDCNANGIPDNLDIAQGTSEDCNVNEVPDECDIAEGTSTDLNGNTVPDECEVSAPLAASWPYGFGKNRYISLAPNNSGGVSVALQIELESSVFFPDSAGLLGWIGEPDGEGISRITTTPFYTDGWPAIVHVGDCWIVPAATYHVRATADEAVFSEDLELDTVSQPSPKYWCDAVGSYIGDEWTGPNGVVSMDDIMATIQMFQASPSAPPLVWVDVDPQVPNKVVNMTDVMQMVGGFKGLPYPFSAPADCP